MSGDGRDWRDIADKASALPEDRFLKVVRLFEHVRAEPGVADAMSLLRPRMTSLRPPRKLTPERLFFLPAEGLLDDAARYRRSNSRISRGALTPVWRVVEAGLPTALLQRCGTAVAGGDRADTTSLIDLGTPLWREGARVLRVELAACEKDLKRRTRVFGRDDDVLRQAALVADIAAVGDAVEGLKAALPPRPVAALNDFHRDAIRDAVTGVAKRGIRDATVLLLVLAARMLRPGDLLALLTEFDLPCSRDDCAALAQDVGVATMESLLKEAADLPDLPAHADRAEQVAAAAERLVDGLESLRNRVDGRSWRKLSPRVEATRASIAKALREAVIAPAEDTLMGPGRSRDRAGDDHRGRAEQAERFAMAFRRASRVAPFGGVKEEMDATAQTFCREVRSIAEAMRPGVDHMGLPAPEETAELDRRLSGLLRLVEIVSGPEEADAILVSWEEKMAKAPWFAGG